jgi:hypothetical protein
MCHEKVIYWDLTKMCDRCDIWQRNAVYLRCIDYCLALGYSEDIIDQAFIATNMERQDVGIVIESIQRGDGIPGNISGVWTEEDDRVVLLGRGGEEYDDLVEKHDSDRCRQRRLFLEGGIVRSESIVV